MSRHSYASRTWRIPGRVAATVVMLTELLSPNLQCFLIPWQTLKASSQPFENSNDGWSGYRRSMIFITFSRMRSPLRLTCSWLARNHSVKAASMIGNFTVFWRLELRLEVVALASNSADSLSVLDTVAWLTLSWWVSFSHLISSFYVALGWSFLYRTRAGGLRPSSWCIADLYSAWIKLCAWGCDGVVLATQFLRWTHT